MFPWFSHSDPFKGRQKQRRIWVTKEGLLGDPQCEEEPWPQPKPFESQDSLSKRW